MIRPEGYGEEQNMHEESTQVNEKQEIRNEILALRTAMETTECQTKSREICSRIHGSDAYQGAKVIYAYMAFRNEADLSELLYTAYQEHKLIAIPRIADGWMSFYCPRVDVNGIPVTEAGYFGIQEPAADALPAPRPDLIIFPGVAFDKSGNRLGYGRGYYDAFMASMQGTPVLTIGAAYECQLVEQIPAEEHDFRLQSIVTEQAAYECMK